MEEGQLMLEDFGQKVDLSRRIREVLVNYPEGTTVLKEIIQNADDAGASTVCFCLDQRSHPADTLLSPKLKEWQGPALLAFNDSQFTDEDFISISKIGDSHKRAKSWKTGRFGVGFNSVYHLTDVPSFVSGKYVVFFDPQRKYLPNVTSANPGKRIEFVNSSALSLYKDQFSPYCAFNCDMKNPYTGTLFRFPLRNGDQAAVSELSKQAYTIKDINSLLKQLYAEATMSLLFLKSIIKLEIYTWHINGLSPELMYSCHVKLSNSEAICRRESLLLKSSNLKPIMEPVLQTVLLDFVSEAFSVSKVVEKAVSSYIIVQMLSTLSGRMGTLVDHAEKEYDLCLLPWASVAACTSDILDKDCPGRAGHAFCTLPLPVRTGLAVHINGYFELSSNRRDIWYGADMDRAGKMRSEWNLCLLQDVIVPAFIELLAKASKILGPSDLYYSFWPCGSFEEPWKTLVIKFYRDISMIPSMYSHVDGGTWLRPVDAYIYDGHFLKSEELVAALLCLGMPVVTIQKPLVETMFSYCNAYLPNMVCPETVRRFLRSLKDKVLISREHILLLLEYSLDDMIDEEVGEKASCLPVIPLANGDCGVLEDCSKGSMYFICRDHEYTLMRNLSDRIIDNNIPPNILGRLSNIASTRKTNIVLFNHSDLLQLLHLILPADWKNKEVIELNPFASNGHPSESWVKSLWCYLREHCDDISKFLDWPLLPIIGGHLSIASVDLKILDGRLLHDPIKEVLVKLGCKILDSEFDVSHPQLYLYLSSPTASAVLDAISHVAHRQEAQVEALFSNLTCTERRELRRFLLKPKWYSDLGRGQGQITRRHLNICKKLPIFEMYSGTMSEEVNAFTSLESTQKYLVPLHMHRNLIGSDFLYSSSSIEDEVLERFYGIERMTRPLFYKRQVFCRIKEISALMLEDIMLLILQELPQLCIQDPSIRESMKNLDFLPTSSGQLRSPAFLYDPRNEELFNLLEGLDCFPCGRFQESDILDMLQQVGLRTTVSPQTVLQSAKQIEHLIHEDPVKAHQRGKTLLSYLDVNANKWLPQQSTNDGSKNVNKMFTRLASVLHFQETDTSAALNKFWNDLRMICWCPVLVDPPYSLLPWPAVSTSVAPPKLVRLASDIWFVSASLRILDGECRSDALSHHLGWSSSPGGSIIAGQLLELGKNHEFIENQEFRQALALAMPRMYSLLTSMIGTDEMDIVKAILEGSRWVWVGDGFAKVDEVVLNGPLHLAPYVRVIPVDLAVFKELFLKLGVKDVLSPRDFALVLSKMAAKKLGTPLDSQELRAAILIVQLLADAHFHDNQIVCYIPDSASILTPASDLSYNDAPWLSSSDDFVVSVGAPCMLGGQSKRALRFVHSNISNDVAERLGVCSLRRLLLAESADSLKLGLHGAAEAFGQHEALTTRLKHIVEMYADGPGILFELVQNADDAGASEVCFLLDKTNYGTSSLLSPQMAEWQGPALYCYNNSVFTAQDLYAISRIGQDSKLEKPFTIGRFGLGFNCVYHFTDVPGFISGDNIVIFDPHASNLPGVTPSYPGLRISFVGRGIMEQFPDQFSPYLHFGCDLHNSFPGTLFRFPLRSPNVASSSQIKRESYKPENVLSLFSSFYKSAGEALLFLRNVSVIKLYVKEGATQEMVLMHRVSRQLVDAFTSHSIPTKAMLDFVHGDQVSGINKEQFYQRLQRIPDSDLPWNCHKVLVTSTEVTERSDLWMVSECLGGGQAKRESVALSNRTRNFVPWASVAAKIQHLGTEEDKRDLKTEDITLLFSSSASDSKPIIQGSAFCFLPLPIHTGLPVHVNAYFELSSNRRDIWFGDDMTGGGKLRSDWNSFLLEDAAAPAYARLLASIAADIGSCSAYYMIWPTETLRKPWASLMQKVYKSITDLELRVLFTKARGGQWISAKKAVFLDFSFPEATELGNSLAEAGLPLVDAPKIVVSRFQEFCPFLRYLTPQLLRDLLIRRKRGFKKRDATLLTLKYCLNDIDENSQVEKLEGLPLVPLATSLFTSFTRYGQGENLYITTQIEYDLLKDSVPYLLVDRSIVEDVFKKLERVASSRRTNLLLLTPELFEKLLPNVFPTDWHGHKKVLWTHHQGQPSMDWILLFWTYLDLSSANLAFFSQWPILPTTDGHLLQLAKNSKVIMDDGWSENILSLLKKIGCFILERDLPIKHRDLWEYVENATAPGILNALLAASGDLSNLIILFKEVSEGELRELRTYLCQTKWFATGQMNPQHIDIMKNLPIYESYGKKTFVSLPESDKWLKPDGIADELITENFIQTSSEREYTILKDYLGIKVPSKSQFYKENVASIFTQFISQPHVILQVIQELKMLTVEDSAMKDYLVETPFVLTGHGSIQKPSRLYDPRITELLQLVHQDIYFPAKEFRVPEILDFLALLGLKTFLDLQGLLDSARSVEMLYDEGKKGDAFERAKCLLAFFNKIQFRDSNAGEPLVTNTESRVLGKGIDHESSAFAPDRYEENDTVRSCEMENVIFTKAEEEFWIELASIRWCPVIVDPPESGLPWPKSIFRSVAAPKVVRPKSQMWLVCSSMQILDGECSTFLQTKFGWSEKASAGVLAVQLIELSKTYASAKVESDNKLRERLDTILQREIPLLYSMMQEYVGTKDFIILQSLLDGCKWIWIGDNFVSSEELAFDSPAKFQPYLYAVTSELSRFRPLLTALGVRLTFGITDYINVLQRLDHDMKEKPLTSEQINFVQRVLDAVADNLTDETGSNTLLGSILLPDASGTLKPASELVYNDVPWLNGNNVIQNFVHSSIQNDLAERLGAKSLRYMSFIDQEITKDLPCLHYSKINEILDAYGNEDLLLFDLLELADKCQAKKVHILYDKQEHPRQSLLQPNLGDFQGPSLVVALEGAMLSMEEICTLHHNPPWKIGGQVISYGSGLLSGYHLCDVQFVLSNGFLYLFDPSDLVFSSCSKHGDMQSSQAASAKMYSLQGTDLPERFHDQFLPFCIDKRLSWASSNTTIIRMPLKLKVKDDVELYDQKIKSIFNKFKSHGSSVMLFLTSVKQVYLSTFELGGVYPINEYSVSVDPVAATVGSIFPGKKWRKFQISNLFSSSSSATKLLSMDVCTTMGGTTNYDRWLVSITLGSGQTRNMALDRRYMAYNLVPIAGVAAIVSRNGKFPHLDSSSCILSPLPLSYSISLPVSIFGCFLLCHDRGRYLFKNENSVTKDQSKCQPNYQLITSWNTELMSCVRDSYVELIVEMQRLRKDASSSRLDPNVARVTRGIFCAAPDRIYLFWPRSNRILSSSNNIQNNEEHDGCLKVLNVEWQCLVERVVRPVYSRLVGLPVWQLYGGEVVKAEDGMFLATPATEASDNSPPMTVCSFIKERYPIFSVPSELVLELKAVGVCVKEITPKMVRALLKASPTSIVLRSVEMHVDILEYCFSDLKLQVAPRPSTGMVSVDNQHCVSFSNDSQRSQLVRNHLLSPRIGSHGGPSMPIDTGGDPLELVTNFGRALLDFGRGVVEDFSRVGGPFGQGYTDNEIVRNRDNIAAHIAYIVGEIKGLPCPTATKHLLRIGSTDMWIGTKEQQTLMQPLAVKFLHLECFNRLTLAQLFENHTLQKLLRLQTFSAQLLSTHLKSVLPSQWISRINDNYNSPWVLWDDLSGDSSKCPTADWLRIFWRNVNSSEDELRLFSDWPLIPAVVSSSVLCRIKQRHLVFVPPGAGNFRENDSGEMQLEVNSPYSSPTAVNVTVAFEEVDSKHPWLLPVLKRCKVPIYNKSFLDCSVLYCCLPRPEQTLPQLVISKLLAAKQAGYFSPDTECFTTVERDNLFNMFAVDSSTSPSVLPTYTSEELDMLKSLPIYKTLTGAYRSVSGHDCCVIGPSAFFQPTDERCICHASAGNSGALFHVLGIPVLRNEELLVKFGLPEFERKEEHDQESILSYIYQNWEELQSQDIIINSLKDTRLVKCASCESNNILYKPQELLDPNDSLLISVFAMDTNRFPGERFATEGWLKILRKTGLRSAAEPEMLLECARRIEMLAQQSTLNSRSSDDFDVAVPSFNDEVSLDTWLLAFSVTEAILNQSSLLYQSSFCNTVSQIAFVPAERGMPNTIGHIGGKRVLTSYSEAILLRDWPLAWSCSPILVAKNVIPPEFAWRALHLRSPPPFATVLRHLQTVGRNYGEETLARWPISMGMKTVEDTFADILLFMNNTWGTLSNSDILELQKVPFIPVANGTRLVTANALYVRLSLNLAPFAFELPSLYLPYVKILKEMGLQEAPSYGSMRNLLSQIQQSSGYQHLNPNELRAVLQILKFIYEEGIKSKLDGTEQEFPLFNSIVPDDGCRLVHSRSCVYVDPLGSRFINEIDTSRLRFVNKQLSEDLCEHFGVKKLSDVVIEELDNNQPLEILETLGVLSLKFVTNKLRSETFHIAIWIVVQKFKEHVTVIQQLTKQRIKEVLESCAERLQFVRCVYTRFLMLPHREEITVSRYRNFKQSNNERQQINETLHQALYFVDHFKRTIVVGEPPDAVSVTDVLAVLVSHLLDSPLCLPISSLFNVPLGAEVTTVEMLRLGSHNKDINNELRLSGCQHGLIGEVLMPSDAMQVQFHPLRPFYAGEIIAWRSENEEGEKLKYGRVPEDVRPSAGQPLYRLQVETAPRKTESLLSSNVLSFKSMVSDMSCISNVNIQESTRSGTLQMQEHENGQTLGRSSNKLGTANKGETSRKQSMPTSRKQTVSTSEIVHAISDMFSTAGITMNVEQQSLLQQVLSLREQLTLSQAALVIEQERAETAVKEAETARTNWSCRICLNSEVNSLLVPCGHVLCQQCCSAVSRCPFCRHHVSKALKLYRP